MHPFDRKKNHTIVAWVGFCIKKKKRGEAFVSLFCLAVLSYLRKKLKNAFFGGIFFYEKP